MWRRTGRALPCHVLLWHNSKSADLLDKVVDWGREVGWRVIFDSHHPTRGQKATLLAAMKNHIHADRLLLFRGGEAKTHENR